MVESSICEFVGTPCDTFCHLALERGCERPYLRLEPFAEPLPAEIGDVNLEKIGFDPSMASTFRRATSPDCNRTLFYFDEMAVCLQRS